MNGGTPGCPSKPFGTVKQNFRSESVMSLKFAVIVPVMRSSKSPGAVKVWSICFCPGAGGCRLCGSTRLTKSPIVWIDDGRLSVSGANACEQTIDFTFTPGGGAFAHITRFCGLSASESRPG